MSRSDKKKNIWGDEYVETTDDQGRKISESRAQKDIWGDEYVETTDNQGQEVSESRTKKDIWGNEYIETTDPQGRIVSESRTKKDIWGDEYVETYDAEGRKISESRTKKDIWGSEYVETTKEPSGGGGGGGGGDLNEYVGCALLIAVFAAVVIAIALSPIWLGAVAVAVVTGFALAHQASPSVPNEALSRLPVREEATGKVIRLRLSDSFFKRMFVVQPVTPWLVVVTFIFGSAMASLPFLHATDGFAQALMVVAVIAGCAVGTQAGRKVFCWQLENLIVTRITGNQNHERLAPTIALVLSLLGLILLCGIWINAHTADFAGRSEVAYDATLTPNDFGKESSRPQSNAMNPAAGASKQSRGSVGSNRVPFRPDYEGPYPGSKLQGTTSSGAAGSTPGWLGNPNTINGNEEGVRVFLSRCIALENTHRLDSIMANYAEVIDYWDKGVVTRSTVRQDKEQYFARWPITEEQIISPIDVTATEFGWRAVFKTRFRVEAPSRGAGLQGTQEGTYQLQWTEVGFRITSVRGRVLERKNLESSSIASVPSVQTESRSLLGEKYPHTRLLLLTPADVSRMSHDELRYAINEMFARHGADFRTREIKQHFERFPWYRSRPGLTYDQIEAGFSNLEKENLKVLGAARDAQVK